MRSGAVVYLDLGDLAVSAVQLQISAAVCANIRNVDGARRFAGLAGLPFDKSCCGRLNVGRLYAAPAAWQIAPRSRARNPRCTAPRPRR